MTHISTGPHPLEAPRPAERLDGSRGAVRERRISLPLRMDDGQIRIVDLPSALAHPSQFSAVEFERLTRVYAEALGLLDAQTAAHFATAARSHS